MLFIPVKTLFSSTVTLSYIYVCACVCVCSWEERSVTIRPTFVIHVCDICSWYNPLFIHFLEFWKHRRLQTIEVRVTWKLVTTLNIRTANIYIYIQWTKTKKCMAQRYKESDFIGPRPHLFKPTGGLIILTCISCLW